MLNIELNENESQLKCIFLSLFFWGEEVLVFSIVYIVSFDPIGYGQLLVLDEGLSVLPKFHGSSFLGILVAFFVTFSSTHPTRATS